MRGYRFLKKENKLDMITNVKDQLTNTSLKSVKKNASTLLMGAGFKQTELIIKQYLLVRIGATNLNKSLLYAIGKPGSAVSHPMPAEWRKVIEQNGFKVAKIRSALVWNGFIVMMFAYGIALICKFVLNNFLSIICPTKQDLGEYAFFDSLSSGNLPQPCLDGKSHDIVTWYVRWMGRVPKLNSVCHTVKDSKSKCVGDIPIISLQSAIQPLSKLFAMCRFTMWSMTAIVIAIVDLLRGHWWSALMLGESAKAAQVRFQDCEKLAREYLFHNSGWIYRPLWTYEAEIKGSRILFYFYSTNCESFKKAEGYPIQANSWQVLNWQYYLVWDQYQADFIHRSVSNETNTKIVGPIWFSSSPKELYEIPKRAIAVFDVQPVRDSLYQTLGIPFEYYIPNTSCRFVNDIYKTAIENNCIVVLKRKRKINRLAHYKYQKFLESFDGNPNFISIDPEVSAIRLIEKSKAVISMPFTSTALYGRDLGKPSVYYDPLGIIQKDDRAAHGIPIITGPQELSEWLNCIIDKES